MCDGGLRRGKEGEGITDLVPPFVGIPLVGIPLVGIPLVGIPTDLLPRLVGIPTDLVLRLVGIPRGLVPHRYDYLASREARLILWLLGRYVFLD